MKDKAPQRKSAVKMSQFFKSEDETLRELETEQILQVLRAFLVVHTYSLRIGRI